MASVPVRAAVIGVGEMGRHHARVYAELPGVELAGVADLDANAAASTAKRFCVPAYSDYLQLLEAERPNVVSLAVPTLYHRDMALEIIARGVHLLVEKPIAATLEEGREMIRAAEMAGVCFMVGHIERFNSAVIALEEQLAYGRLGRVFQVDARRQGPFPKRVADVGVIVDLAVHDLDVIRYVTGSEVVRVYAELDRHVHKSREDTFSGLVRLGSGAIGTLGINWLTPTKIRELSVTGECGMYRVDYLTQDLYFYENSQMNGDDWEALQVLRGVSEGRMIRHVVTKREPLRAEIEAFVAAALGERPVPISGSDALRAVELAHLLVYSGSEHCTVAT